MPYEKIPCLLCRGKGYMKHPEPEHKNLLVICPYCKGKKYEEVYIKPK